jgi:pimeloyl-ACP methyl ester carboxylesterase
VNVHYTREGAGPALFLLHATLSSSRQLRPLATRLAQDHTVISVDRRGSGLSVTDGPAEPIEVGVHVADLVAIAHREGLAGLTVVGHSYGGCVALELAARQPALVDAAFAYEPPYAPVAPAEVQAGMAEVGRRTLAARDADGLADAALAFMAGVSGPDAVEALSPAARARVARAGRGAIADATLAGMDPAGLGRIAARVRIATGSASHSLYEDIATGLLAVVPSADHVRLNGLDHMAPVLRPDLFAGAIGEWEQS